MAKKVSTIKKVTKKRVKKNIHFIFQTFHIFIADFVVLEKQGKNDDKQQYDNQCSDTCPYGTEKNKPFFHYEHNNQ